MQRPPLKRSAFLALAALLAGCHGKYLAPPSGLGALPPVGSHQSYTIYAFQNPNGEDALPLSPPGDGAQPKGTLTLVPSGGFADLYGRTAAGGNSTNCGAFFYLSRSDPSNYRVFYRFSATDGCSPRHDAMVFGPGGLLYSTTQGVSNDGKQYNSGDIVTVKLATGAVSILHQFAGAPSDGAEQHSSFSYDAAGNAFGMTASGGANNKGFLYYIPAGSTTPIGLHDFKKSDGDDPHGRIVLLGSTMWGITRAGGSNDLGVVFSLPVPSPLPPSSVDLPITLVHQFAGHAHDGAFSDHGYLTAVTQNGSTVLYGMTQCGGSGDGGDGKNCKGEGDGDGVIFQIDPASGSYNTFYEFTGTNNDDGANPYGSLTYDPASNALYGMTRNGGKSDDGTVFKIVPGPFGTTGSIAWQYHFTGKDGDGANPIDNVIVYNGKLYGMTSLGGASSNAGTIFAMPLP